MEKSMYPSGSKLLSDMSVIIIGYEEGGKTSSGNTILGRKEFALKKSAECIKKHGVVAGRQITVIDTPGRKRDYLASSTPQLYKDEVVRSVALCPSGPHALLLVINITCSFECVWKQAVEEHVKLFGENVWNHILVLFTHGDKLEEITIEQHFQNEGEPLQKLLQKCRNRYHVFNNMDRDASQVHELLRKIEEMVEQNISDPFEMDKAVLQGLIMRKMDQDERAKNRRMMMPRPKDILRSPTDLRIVLLECGGECSVGNTLQFTSETIPTSAHTESTVAGRQVTVIDTPGWSKAGLLKDSPRKPKQEIVHSVSLLSPGPHAFLLVIPVDTSFTDDDERSIIDHLGFFGEEIWRHVIVLFTHTDWMGDTAIEMYIEGEGEALQRLLDKCGNRYHALNNMDVHDRTQVKKLLEKIEHNIKVNGGNYFEMDKNILHKMECENSQKEVEGDKMHLRGVKNLTPDSSGCGRSPCSSSMSIKVSNSTKENLPKIQTNNPHTGRYTLGLQRYAEKERSMLTSVSEQTPTEMRIIILGCEEGGKTSLGNTILGREAFALKKSAECIKKQRVVAGRQIVVIDTPGRKRDYLAPSTPQLYKEEVVHGVALCPPGPHALLLVNRAHLPFEPQALQAVEEHLKLFGENVWNHIIVLFTHVDLLENMTIEQRIQKQGEPLQKLLVKCGNRYHVLNNMEKDDKQVKELLKKIEEMVEQNKGHHFEMDKLVLQNLVVRKMKQAERAKERRKKMLKPEDVWSTTDMRIILLGCQCSGKSSAGDTILGENMFQFKTKPISVPKQATVAGRQVTVIDTPGWSKGGLFKDTPIKSKLEIVRSVSLCAPGPHAFLLVIPVDTTFTDDDERSVIDHVQLFGEEVWNYVIMVFTYADWMGDTAIEMYIESEGEALQRLVDKCGNRYHALNNMYMDDRTQVRGLLEKIEHIMVNRGSFHFQMDDSCLDKIKSENLQEELKCEGKSVTHPTVSLSSGYSSLSLKSSESIDKPPVMRRANEKGKTECGKEFKHFDNRK